MYLFLSGFLACVIDICQESGEKNRGSVFFFVKHLQGIVKTPTFAIVFHGIRFKVRKIGCRDDNLLLFLSLTSP